MPIGFRSFSEALRAGAEVYHTLGRLLKENSMLTAVGDEGGFAPSLSCDEEAIEYIIRAIEEAGYTTDKIKLALDAASSEWYKNDEYILPKRGTRYTGKELLSYTPELPFSVIIFYRRPIGRGRLAVMAGVYGYSRKQPSDCRR